MATAIATFTLNAFPKGIGQNIKNMDLFGTIAVSASPATYATNGLALAFTDPQIDTNNLPFFGTIVSPSSGYVYAFDPVHQTLRIFSAAETTGAPLVELGNGVAIPVGVSGDTIYANFAVIRN